MIISDDDHGIIGSINMDYRSFHYHFENGVWMVGSPIIRDIKRDMMQIFSQSEEISLEAWAKRPWYIKGLQTVLRLFSVLL